MLPRHRNVYVSAICDRSASVSGPPPTIALLLEQETELTSYPSKKLGIGAAFHAEHLSLPDMTPVFGTSTCLDESLRPNCKIMSTGSGAVLQATTMRDALRIAATDILQLPLRLDLVLDSLNAEAKDHQVHISSFGPCGFTKSVQQALTKNGVDVSFDEEVLPEGLPSTPSSDELIAVVGMAGRFPEGDTLDEFWDVIWSGRDVHKTVRCNQIGSPRNANAGVAGAQ
jgi:naphtho-gamma-pyrone polyketide synthase